LFVRTAAAGDEITTVGLAVFGATFNKAVALVATPY
jgi:hypothetical protein